MTTENNRADALTETLKEEMDRLHREFSAMSPLKQRMWLMQHAAASPVEQLAAAPIPEDCDVRNILLDVVPGEDGEGQEVYARNVADVERLLSEMGEKLDAAKQPAPSPADERAAFDLTNEEWLDVFERVSASIPNVFGGYMKVRAAFAREAIRLADEARMAASPVGKIAALIAERDAAIMNTHRQALCIQQCAAHIGRETSATIDGLPLAVRRLVKERDEARAALPEDRIDWIANTHCPGGTAYPVNVKNAIREALREARISDNETEAQVAQQLSAEIAELKIKLVSYESEHEDQTRYLAAQSEEIAGLKQQLAHADARVGLTATVIQKCIDSCAAEYLEDVTGHPEDAAYCQGITDCIDALNRLKTADWSAILAAHPGQPEPIDMLLFCPKCGAQHVDAPEKASDDRPVLYADAWTNPPHRSHLCHACGTVWRPADVPTNGVAAIQTSGKADTWSGQPVLRAEVTDEPSLTNPLTPYGMLVRALRIVSGTTLMDMADALLTTPAKLSAMEFDREPVTPEFAFDVAAYFDAIGVLHTASALRAAAARTGGQ
ncbi:Uncharacterised protein [Burkholderia pseudomallei]|nr:Uncharacterised protein [Burkholderia pseudomallei]